MTIPAGDGSGLAPLPPQLQMAAFTLAMQGILHIRAPRLGAESMASEAFFYRLPLFPDVAPALVFVMTTLASHPALFVHPVAKAHRRLLPGASYRNGQGAGGRGFITRTALSSQDTQYS